MENNTPLLQVQNLGKRFGGLQALSDVHCTVNSGMIFAIIGPNGAGKTTFFNCLTGVEKPTSGTIHFRGTPTDALPPHRFAALGIARTWQTIRLFEHMTVLENVLVGCHPCGKSGILSAAFRPPWQRKEEKKLKERALHHLDKMGIAELANEPVSRLPFLKQRRVELARALAPEPSLLLLDEPAAGLNTRETAELGDLIRRIRADGVTVALVEHDMSLVMEISDQVLVLDRGTPIATGAPREVQEDPKVIEIYLGTGDDDTL